MGGGTHSRSRPAELCATKAHATRDRSQKLVQICSIIAPSCSSAIWLGQSRLQVPLTGGALQIESCKMIAPSEAHTFIEAVTAHVEAQREMFITFRHDAQARTVADRRKQPL